MPNKAAIYRRVSTEEQAREGYSLDAQYRNLTKYCEYKGYVVVAAYVDEGVSARTTKNRHGFMQMMADAKDGKFNIIVSWSVSRLSRSVADLYNTWERLKQYGVEIESQSENFDTSTAIGTAVFGLIGVFAQLESDITSERVKVAARERAEQGKRTCSDVLGYDRCGKDTLAVNDQEAEIVRYIYGKYIEYRNLSAVAECCRLNGYTGKRGRQLKAESIKKILSCPVYVGCNRFKGELYKGAHEPIITTKTYSKAQRMLGNTFPVSRR